MVKKFIEQTGSKEFAKIDPGVHEARVLRIIDLGVQPPHPAYNKYPDGNLKPPQSQLLVVFEASPDDSEESFLLFKNVNVSKGEKATLQKIADAAGVSLDGEILFEKMVGAAVSLTVGVTGEEGDKRKVKAITGVSARTAQSVPPLKGKAYFFDFDDPDPTILLEEVPQFAKDTMAKAVNYEGSTVQQMIDKHTAEQAELKDEVL